MPSLSATRRASWMSWPAQQPPLRSMAAPWSYNCSVTPITSWPASCSKPATTLLSTPPDMATTTRMLLLVHVVDALRQRHGQSVQRFGDDDLATKPRSLGQAEGEVQHVLLVLGRLGQFRVPRPIDDH